MMKMFEYGSKVIAEKRARPGEDLASKLLACEVDGRRLEDMEFLLFFLLLVDAGGDTTRNLVAGGVDDDHRRHVGSDEETSASIPAKIVGRRK